MSRLQMASNFEQIRHPPDHPATPRPQTPPEALWKRVSLNPGAIVVIGALALGFAFVVSMHSPRSADSAAPAVALAAPVTTAPEPTEPAPPAAVAKIETAAAPAPAPAPAVVTPAHVDPVTTGAIPPKKPKHKPKLKHLKPAADDE